MHLIFIKEKIFCHLVEEINPHKDINKFLKKIKQKRLKVNKLILNVQHYSKLPDIIKKLSKGEISHGRNLINFKNLS